MSGNAASVESQSSLLRRKPIGRFTADSGLARILGGADLMLLGIGAIIGAGIFVLTGIAAATLAGPAVVLSFVVAGTACALAALCYAELAAAVGGSGSAYGYAYAAFGELIAWIIGWDLILEYTVAVAAVAVGWSGYVLDGLASLGLGAPEAISKAPADGGIANLPAAGIVLALGGLLMLGARASARANAAIVGVKLTAIAVFVIVAAAHLEPANWQDFAPFGWQGVVGGAALVFFAFIGFDAVSTAAEEARNPQRDLPRGIVGSLLICTLLYVAVAALLTMIVPYESLDVPSPVSHALLMHGASWASAVVAAGAIAGLTSVMLVLYYGQTRVFLAMSRDGLLPRFAGEVSGRTRTPAKVIAACGAIMALLAAFMPLAEIAELVNIGTLAAFVIVCTGVFVLRLRQPNMARPFRIRLGRTISILGALSCLYLMMNLGLSTWLRFAAWMLIGLALYFGYARSHSRLATNPSLISESAPSR